MEVRLRSSRMSWTCRIFLRFETHPDGSSIEVVREVPFGPALTSPDDVEAALRRAQLAVLNPSVRDVEAFLKLSDADVLKAKEGKLLVANSAQQLTFSDNLVCLDVSGPSVTDLAFLDLPGIISNSDTPGDIELIESMVKKSIIGNCLILLTITMRDDYQNQKAALLAKEADPDGKRTIGVLTKADTVQAGEHDNWIALLEGRQYHLANGYFCTKQPGAEDLKKNLSFEQARAAEIEFFKMQAPWNGLAGSKNRLGTGNLTKFLSDRLGKYIAEKLPELQGVLNKSLIAILDAIKALPPPPSADPTSELHSRIGRLTQDLEALAVGRNDSLQLLQQKNRNDKRFQQAIKATRPIFTPFAAKEKDKIESWQKLHKESKKPSVAVLRMNLDEVKVHIESHKGREVPLNTPYGAKASLFLLALTAWADIASDTLEHLRKPVAESVDQVAKRHFGSSISLELRSKTTMAISDVIGAVFNQAHERLGQMLELEKTPFTLNTPYFARIHEEILAEYKDARQDKKAGQSVDKVNDALAALAKAGFTGITVEQLAKLHQSDNFEEELEAMAQTMGYWTVACERFIDNVPRVLDCAIIGPLPTVVQDHLLARLCAGDPANIARLMAEDADVADQRSELNMRLQRLDDAKRVLVEFGHDL
ncbi:hypothetical protein JCM8097_004088 [Rhodosporidiobolus ruineniae]